jgi:hypothetical protein
VRRENIVSFRFNSRMGQAQGSQNEIVWVQKNNFEVAIGAGHKSFEAIKDALVHI